MLEELAEGEVDGGQREDVGTAVGEVERIVALINVVLDVSKAEAGRLHLETLPFHTRSWLRDALHSHACAAHACNLTCNTLAFKAGTTANSAPTSHPIRALFPITRFPALEAFAPSLLCFSTVRFLSSILLIINSLMLCRSESLCVCPCPVACRVDTSVPEVLEGDYMRLQQVLDSIVGESSGGQHCG
ncbi:unnamed protein product [Closterium sp. Yama58-4]|nr:unnamed protein product [Closterium sp. Yama58-4]